jgi:hypothetical protein
MNLPYAEGSLFLVPLRNGGFARGVIARAGPKGGTLFGYFFAPRIESAENCTKQGLWAARAVLSLMFSDLALIRGIWPVIGEVDGWKRAEWPMPPFVRVDALGKLAPRLVIYSDDDPDRRPSERVIGNSAGLQHDSLSYYASVEIQLDDILA